MENNLIQLKQKPIITHQLKEIGENVTKRINDLNLEKQVATEDTIKTLKDLRAELRKEAVEFEERRKFIKEAVTAPYNEFEAIYKEEIINKFTNADSILKTKINDFEMKIKVAKKESLVDYFSELCQVEKIDWLTFDSLNIEINLSTSEKKYKEQILSVISGIVEDLALINTEEHAAEILVEYKKTLKASQSIQEIRRRKEAEKQEQARIQMERTNKRISQLRLLTFIYHDLTRTYNWAMDESVMINYSEVENLSNEEWIKRYAELESKAKKEEKKEILQTPKTVTQPISTEKEEKKPEIFIASFEVTGTYEQLKSISEFLKSNNINYKNI